MHRAAPCRQESITSVTPLLVQQLVDPAPRLPLHQDFSFGSNLPSTPPRSQCSCSWWKLSRMQIYSDYLTLHRKITFSRARNLFFCNSFLVIRTTLVLVKCISRCLSWNFLIKPGWSGDWGVRWFLVFSGVFFKKVWGAWYAKDTTNLWDEFLKTP